jgi:hypothetical protein
MKAAPRSDRVSVTPSFVAAVSCPEEVLRRVRRQPWFLRCHSAEVLLAGEESRRGPWFCCRVSVFMECGGSTPLCFRLSSQTAPRCACRGSDITRHLSFRARMRRASDEEPAVRFPSFGQLVRSLSSRRQSRLPRPAINTVTASLGHPAPAAFAV